MNEGIVRRVGRAFVTALSARRVVIGRDCRASSSALLDACIAVLLAGGTEVFDLGLCGTEEMYFAVTHLKADGGIEVTASHNPMEYNGIKLVRAGSAPLDTASGLAAIKAFAMANDLPDLPGRRVTRVEGERAASVTRVVSFVDLSAVRPMTILVNAGNGAAGPTFDAIAAAFEAHGAPLGFVQIHHEPAGSFPNDIPNPLLPEN